VEAVCLASLSSNLSLPLRTDQSRSLTFVVRDIARPIVTLQRLTSPRVSFREGCSLSVDLCARTKSRLPPVFDVPLFGPRRGGSLDGTDPRRVIRDPRGSGQRGPLPDHDWWQRRMRTSSAARSPLPHPLCRAQLPQVLVRFLSPTKKIVEEDRSTVSRGNRPDPIPQAP